MNNLKQCSFCGEHPKYCLKIDIAKCFYHVSHDKVLDMFQSITDDERFIELISTIVNNGGVTMADKIRFFKTYWNGMNLTAMVRPGLAGWSLDVDCLDYDGKKHPYFNHSYKDERGAVRAMSTRFRGAEWEETT